jgi:hypothetical protein
MELIMKLVERLVIALETQADNSTRQLAVAEQNLAVNQEMLEYVKAQREASSIELVAGSVEATQIRPAGDGNTPAGLAAAKEHAEMTAKTSTAEPIAGLSLHGAAQAAEQTTKANPPDMQAAMNKAEANRAAALAEAQAKTGYSETTHVTQATLDAAEQASKAAAQAKKKVTVDDVRNELKAYAKAHGNEAAMALLQKHEAVSVSAMDPSKYDAFLADLK